MQKLIGGLGRQIDTGSPPPGSTYGGAYWTEEAERRDRERKALRAGSIPVPAAALAANKQIDEITRANLLVDWLADKDNFHHMTLNTPGFARMSADQQLREIEGLMEEVKEAPLNQQESARRGLVDELKGVGGLIGRGFQKAWDIIDFDTPLDPYLDPAMSAGKSAAWQLAERGGQEIGGGVLYGVQKLMPGQQELEARYNARKKNDDAPWWKKQLGFSGDQWISSTIRDDGWSVPAGVHIPLEIVFDPWNLALGAGFVPDILRGARAVGGLARGGARGLGQADQAYFAGGKWIGKGASRHWVDTDIGLKGKVLTRKELEDRAAALAATKIARNIAEGTADRQDDLFNMVVDDLMEDDYGIAQVDPKTGEAYYIVDEATGERIPRSEALARLAKGGEAPGGSQSKDPLSLREREFKNNEVIKADEVTEGDLYNMSPKREPPWRKALKSITEQDELPEEARWVLRAMYHLGLRPNELEAVTKKSLERALEQREFKELAVTIEGQSSPRRLTGAAAEFLQEYAERRKSLIDDAAETGDEAAFFMPKGETLNAKSINKYFEEAALRAKDSGGEGLLEYYAKNKNYSYVFRLSLANEVYMTTAGIRATMLALGHTSHFHTARYVSSTFYNRQTIEQFFTGASDALRGLSDVKAPKGVFFTPEAIAAAEQSLIDRGFNLFDEGWDSPISIFDSHSKAEATRKGLRPELMEQRRRAVMEARVELLRTIVSGHGTDLARNPEELMLNLPGGILPETADRAQELMELGTFAQVLSDMLIEKGLLKTSKEAVEGLAKGEVNEAKLEFSKLEEWLEPILDLSNEWAAEIALDDLIGATMESALLAPFRWLGYSQLNKMAIAKKGGQYGGSGSKRKMDSLAKLFGPWWAVQKKAGLKGKQKLSKAALADIEDWEKMSAEAQEGMRSGDLPINFVLRQSNRGLKKVDGVKQTRSNRLWLVTEWLHAPVEGQSETFAKVVNFINQPGYKPSIDDMIVYKTSEGKRAIMVVHIDGRGPQAFYRSTGKNSKMPNQWLPFDGIRISDDYKMPGSRAGGKGWVDKAAFQRNQGDELDRFGKADLKRMSEKLTKMNLPCEDARVVDNLEEINSWINTAESLKRNRPFSEWESAWGPGDIPMAAQQLRKGEVVGAKIIKLAKAAVEGGLLVKARQLGDDLEREITQLDFNNWDQYFDAPVPEAVIRAAFPGGPTKLNPTNLAQTLIAAGFSVSQMQQIGWRMSKITPNLQLPGKKKISAKRLRASDLLEELPNDQYKFKQEVIDEYMRLTDGLGDTHEAHGWQKKIKDILGVEGGAGGGRVRRPPGATSAADEPWGIGKDRPLDWNDLKFMDEDGIEHHLGEVIVNPRGIKQPGLQFSGGKIAKAFFDGLQTWRPLGVEVRGLNRFIRMIVPGTFAASDGAMLRWQYMFSKKQGQLISSDIGHLLGEFHTVLGMTHDGIAHNLRVLGSVDNFGRAADDSVLRNHTANKAYESMLDDFRADPKEGWKWTDSHINNVRKRWSHQKNLQDASTFLQTPRDELHLYYDTAHTWKARGLGPTHIKGADMSWKDMLKMHDYYHQIDPQLWRMMDDAGVDMKDVLPANALKKRGGKLVAELDPNFVPALITNHHAGGEALKKGTQLGASPTQFLPREYPWQIMGKLDAGKLDGQIRHEVYNADPVLAMQRQVEGYYKYIADERFMDAYAKLGIPETERGAAIGAGKAIQKYRFWSDEAVEAADFYMTAGDKKSAAAFYGADWEKLPEAAINERLRQYRAMDAAWTDIKLKGTQKTYVVASKPLASTALPPDASRELMALGSDELNSLNPFVSVPSAISNMMRLLATGADLGVTMLHGFGGLGIMMNPIGFAPETIKGKRIPVLAELHISMKQRGAWAKGNWNMMQGLFSNEVRRKWYESTSLVRADMQKHGVAFFRSTFIEDLPLPGIFDPAGRRGKWTKPGEKLVGVGMKPIEGFGFFLDVSKTEMWKANQLSIDLSAGIKRNAAGEIIEGNKDFYEKQMADFSASLNAIHGTLEPAVAGIQSKQRVFESAFLMYAALYRRAGVALIKNMFSGMPDAAIALGRGARNGKFRQGMAEAASAYQARQWRRGPALQAVSGMLMAGGALGAAIKLSGNNEDVFDLGSADFMSAHVGNLRIGMGTVFYGLLRMGNDVTEQMREDPQGILDVDFSENKIAKWLRSQSSPSTSLVVDLIDGQDFIGSPLRDTNGGWEVNAIGNRTARTLAPFWLESGFHTDGKWNKVRGSLSEFFGLRVSPVSAWGKLQAARNVAILTDTHPELVDWRRSQDKLGLASDSSTIPILFLRRLIDRTPYLQDLEKEVSEDAQHRGSKARKEQDTFIQKIKDNKEDADLALLGVAEKFERHELSGQNFRKAVANIEIELRGANLELGAVFPEVIEEFDRRRTARLDNPVDVFVMDLAYDEYRAVVTNDPSLHDDFGNFDIDRFKTVEAIFRSDLSKKGLGGEKTWAYIQERRKEGRGLPQAVIDLNNARESLMDYWNIHEKVFGSGTQATELINLWRGLATQQSKDRFEARYPAVKRLLSMLDKVKTAYRLKNPSKDRLLVRFYDYSPVHPMSSRDIVLSRLRAPIPTLTPVS